MAKKEKKGISASRSLGVLFLAMAAILVPAWMLTAKSEPQSFAESGLEADPVSGDVLFEVPPKVSLTALSRDLESKGLITNASLFRIFLRASGQDKRIRAGYFYVRRSNSILEMAEKLTSGKMATQTVTIPEGKASWEIFSILKARFPMDSLVFDSLVHSREFILSCGLDAPSLEGYLFPSTYVLPWKVNERDALKVMVRHFLEVEKSFDLRTPMYEKFGRHGWVTLASIVEEEAAVASEQDLIAGVFYNRLVQGWSLGADPTVRYALRKPTGPLYVSELNNDSPYNTRKFTGLPPGPICSPGRGALRASLNPMATDMMYFVAKDDGTREHFFSENNSAHVRYKEVAANNRRKREAGAAKLSRAGGKPDSAKTKKNPAQADKATNR